MSFFKKTFLNLSYLSNFGDCCRISFLITVCCFSISIAKTDIPVFLLSVQSNMTGYANASGIDSDQKRSVETPVDGWVFDYQSGDASGSNNPLRVNINAKTLIYANFKIADGKEDLISMAVFHLEQTRGLSTIRMVMVLETNCDINIER